MTTASATLDQHPADLREYVRILRARRWQIALVTGVALASTLFLSFRQTPIYEGRAKVLVRPTQTAGVTVTIPQAPNLDTERELIMSQAVAANVQQALDITTPVDTLLHNLKVDVVGDTEVIQIAYDDPRPDEAARLANGFAAAYIDYRSQQALDQFEAAATAVGKRIDGVQEKIASLRGQIDAAKDPSLIDSLEAQRDTLVATLGVLSQRLLDLQANQSAVQDAGQIVQPAEAPLSPISPNHPQAAALGLMVGLAFGIGLAFLRERLDDRVKSRQDLERRIGASVIAAVPRVPGWRRRDEAQLITRSDPKSPISEAYRTMATNLQYLASRQPLKVVMITSSTGGEGKSTTSANLAVVLAQAGKRVILMSADLRRPRLHMFFDLRNARGLSDALSGTPDFTQILKDPGLPNLRVIVAGAAPQNPAALLSSPAGRQFVDSLRGMADFIIIDTPPVLAVADASVLAPIVDGTIFVLDASRSSRSALMQSKDQLETAGANLVGAVYNNFDPSMNATYPYYRYHAYQEHFPQDERSSNGNGHRDRIWGPRTKVGGRSRVN